MAKSKTSKTSKSKKQSPSTKAVEEVAVTAQPDEEVVVVDEQVNEESSTDVAADATSDESKSTELTTTEGVEQILEMCKMLTSVVQKLQKEARVLLKRVNQKEKRLEKLESKKANKKKSNAGNQLKKLQPIYTAEFTAFVENNYESLNNKEGEQILTELSYDDNKRLTVSRENCLRLVNSYVRQNKLQGYEDRKRIMMDATLKGLFPELAEVKSGKKVTQEENCYFHTLMGGISRHLKEQ